MRYRIPLIAFLFLISLRLSAAQTPTESPEKPLYNATGTEATVTGTINVTGTIPQPRRIDMGADPVCGQLNLDPRLDDLLVRDNKVQNAFVYLKSEFLNAHRFAVPDLDVVLVQRNCYFSPRVLGLRVGQNLQIINSDQTVHNVHPTPKLNQEWNFSHAPDAPPLVKTFSRAEVLIPFKDNQHPWEKAYVAVMDHPFFAVSDESGRFEIRGLPPGTYRLVVWHERLGEQELEITVIPGENRNAEFTFDADKKH
jgi:Carboxypeptidase regulatory-like domain